MSAPGRVLAVLAIVAAAIEVPTPGQAALTGRAPTPTPRAAPSVPNADFKGDSFGDLAVGVP